VSGVHRPCKLNGRGGSAFFLLRFPPVSGVSRLYSMSFSDLIDRRPDEITLTYQADTLARRHGRLVSVFLTGTAGAITDLQTSEPELSDHLRHYSCRKIRPTVRVRRLLRDLLYYSYTLSLCLRLAALFGPVCRLFPAWRELAHSGVWSLYRSDTDQSTTNKRLKLKSRKRDLPCWFIDSNASYAILMSSPWFTTTLHYYFPPEFC